MSIYINGYNRKSTMDQIKAKNLGRRSTDELGDCLYRSEDGNACLVGCFIPDHKYDSDIEGESSCEVIDKLDLYSDIPLSTSFMIKLQKYHDSELYDSDRFFDLIENKLIELEKENK